MSNDCIFMKYIHLQHSIPIDLKWLYGAYQELMQSTSRRIAEYEANSVIILGRQTM